MQEVANWIVQFVVSGFVFSYLVGLYVLAKERKEARKHREDVARHMETMEEFIARVERTRIE